MLLAPVINYSYVLFIEKQKNASRYRFQALAIDKYDGRTNLEDYIRTFEWHMKILTVGRLAHYKLFHVYLHRTTARCLRWLKNKEIQT